VLPFLMTPIKTGVSADPPNSKKQFQYSLRLLFYITTVVACILAVGLALPLGARQLVIYVVVISVTPLFMYKFLTKADQILNRKDSRLSPAIGSFVLISICTTITMVVLASVLMDIPGRTGPIQYATGNPNGMSSYCLRLITMLFLLSSPVVSGLIGMVRANRGRYSRFGWRFVAIASFLVAWFVVMSNAFFPTA